MEGVYIDVEVRGAALGTKRLALGRVVSEADLRDMRPASPRELEYMALHRDLGGMARLNQREERRRRFIDMVAATVAHQITEALFNEVKAE